MMMTERVAPAAMQPSYAHAQPEERAAVSAVYSEALSMLLAALDELDEEPARSLMAPELASGWEPVTASDGRTYYWHRRTDETTWETPLPSHLQPPPMASPPEVHADALSSGPGRPWPSLPPNGSLPAVAEVWPSSDAAMAPVPSPAAAAAHHGHGSGQAVQLTGLHSRPELNGACGTVLEYVETRRRYTVLLADWREVVALRPANLVAIDGAAAPSPLPAHHRPAAEGQGVRADPIGACGQLRLATRRLLAQ